MANAADASNVTAGSSRGGVLEDVVVVELARTLAGEFAGGLLSDMGATVIKVEPSEGSPMRGRGRSLPGEDSLYFQSENRGKYSVCAELDVLAVEPWLQQLLSTADALIEDLGPGVLEAAGLGPDVLEELNPRLCILRISPFGQTGPLAGERGDDRVAQAFSGAQFTTGFEDRPPIPISVPIADCWTGVQGASGLLMALLSAHRGGAGQVIDLALYETLLRLQEGLIVAYDRDGTVATRMGNAHPSVVPANIYETSDGGFVALSGAGDKPFARLCAAIDAPEAAEDPRFLDAEERRNHRTEADALVGAWIHRHTLQEVEERFASMGVAGTAVRSAADLVSDSHVRARNSLVEMVSQSGQPFRAPACVPRFSRTPAHPAERAPRLGEHTDYVRAQLDALASRPPARAEPGNGPTTGGALDGFRVLDLTQGLAGPVAATSLADFGAEVIMVELPEEGPPEQRSARRQNFLITNRNKRSVSLDVRTPRGRAAFLELLRVSDVLLENFRPGTMERWGLDEQALLELNPRLVMLRASGYGQTGPYRGRSSWNPVAVAFGGVTYLNGWPDRQPLRDGVMAGDYTTALFNVLAILGGLVRRDFDGQGQVADVAMVESTMRMTGDTIPLQTALGITRERAAASWPAYPLSVTVEAADGRYVTVSAQSWDEIGVALGEATEDLASSPEEARDALSAFVGERSSADAVATLQRAGLTSGVVNSVAEIFEDSHVWARGNLVRVEHPRVGEVVTQGVVPLLSRTPGRVWGSSEYPGSDNEAVLGQILGYDSERIRVATAPEAAASSATD